MSTRVQKACAWCGPAFIVVFFSGMLIARYIPPQSPSDSAAQVAHFYSSHTNGTRFGLLLMMVSATFTMPFAAVISVQLKRIEGQYSPCTYTQLLGGAAGAMAILVPVMIFMTVAFRPGRSPELTQTINDLAWIPFIINFPPALTQCISIAVATLGDKRADPVYPRWVAYFNIWAAFLFLPAGLLVFFKHGPFAWNGLLAFWLAAAIFGGWFIVMTVSTLGAIKRWPTSDEAIAAT